MGVTVHGEDEVRRALQYARYEPAIIEARDEIGQQGAEIVRRAVPVATGELRDSVTYRSTASFGELRVIAPHARPVAARTRFWQQSRRELEGRLVRAVERLGGEIARIWRRS